MIAFRHADPRLPFLWEHSGQYPGRWHGEGEGPVHYLADTPDAAWAEFLRHEEITQPEDVLTVRRAMWAVEVDEGELEGLAEPSLDLAALTSGRDTYPVCQQEARRLRGVGARGLRAPSAALLPGSAGGWRVDRGLQAGPPRNGTVFALFGRRPDLVGWAAAAEGRPREELLGKVRHFGS